MSGSRKREIGVKNRKDRVEGMVFKSERKKHPYQWITFKVKIRGLGYVW
jgi:hypothetical protein